MTRLLLENNSLAWILPRETVFSGMGEKYCRPLIAGGQGIAGAFIATLPPERIPPMGRVPLSRWRAWRWGGSLFALDARAARKCGVMRDFGAHEVFHLLWR